MNKLPVESNNWKCYNKNTGKTASGSPAQRGGEKCDVVESGLSKWERNLLLRLGKVQHRRHSDITYYLAYLEELLWMQADQERICENQDSVSE